MKATYFGNDSGSYGAGLGSLQSRATGYEQDADRNRIAARFTSVGRYATLVFLYAAVVTRQVATLLVGCIFAPVILMAWIAVGLCRIRENDDGLYALPYEVIADDWSEELEVCAKDLELSAEQRAWIAEMECFDRF